VQILKTWIKEMFHLVGTGKAAIIEDRSDREGNLQLSGKLADFLCVVFFNIPVKLHNKK